MLPGGLSPFIATELLRRHSSGGPIAAYVIAMALITTLALLTVRETAHDEL